MSQGGNDKDSKGQKSVKQPIPIWPEWSDQDIGSEKWVCFDDCSYEYFGESFIVYHLYHAIFQDISHKGKDKEKGKSPNLVSEE